MYYLDILMKTLSIVGDDGSVVKLPIKSFDLTGFDDTGNYLANIVLPVQAYDSTYPDSIPAILKPKAPEVVVAPSETIESPVVDTAQTGA